MDYTAFALAVATIGLAVLLLGHLLLFMLLHHAAKLPPSLAVRLAHTGGLALGYALAAFVVPQASGAVLFWGGAPLLPGVVVAGLCLLWLLLVWLLPPGPAGANA